MSSFYMTMVTLVITLLLFKYGQSQCSHLSPISSICEDNGYCTLNSNSHCTCGQIQWKQDIAFIFDSSMTSTQWASATQFAANLLYYGSPSLTTTRTAILQTANTSISSTVTLSFDSEAISNTISSTLLNLKQTPQSFFYLQLSVQNALDLFTKSSSSITRKILIIFATQEFKQAPCKINMRANEIYTYTIAIGDFNIYPLTCVGSSENNYEGFISIHDTSQLPTILTIIESITCPHKPLVKITEIQLSGENGEQYLEMYNYGHDTDMSQFQMFGIDRNLTPKLPPLQLNQGRFAVVYNTDNRQVNQQSIPNCINCTCTESSLTISTADIKWCENTIYIGCCNSNIANACDPNNYPFEIVSDCQFVTGLLMNSFSVGLMWTNPQTKFRELIGVLSFDATQQWPIVANNYSLELKNKGFNNQFGSSWSMSCDSNGTPGDEYLLNPCTFDCTVDGTNLCNLNGGINTNQCIDISCDCLDGFYAYYQTCLPLPKPLNCNATAQGPTASITTYGIASWDGDTTYRFFHCDISSVGCEGAFQYSETVTSLLTSTVFDQGRDVSPTLVTLQTIGTGGNTWISDTTNCNHVTNSPTSIPTQSPTYSIPTIPSCSIILSNNLRIFHIVWEPIDFTQSLNSSPPTITFIGYTYYYNDRTMSTVSCCTITASPPNALSFNLNSDWISVSGHWDTSLTGITLAQQLLSAETCSVITQNPTPPPTKSPTNHPTLKPSINPTNTPTISPTLAELYVPTCSAIVLRGISTVNMTWMEANFGTNTALKADTVYVIEWIYNTAKSNGKHEVSADQGTQTLVDIDDYLNVILLQMYCTWSSFTEEGRITTCLISTMFPTISPSISPSQQPVGLPLNIPTISPIPIPTMTPTLAPTYIFDDVSQCNATFPVQPYDKIVLTWELLYVNASDPITPPANWIKYFGIIGDRPPIIAEHNSQHIDCDDTGCWGFDQKSLTPDNNGKFHISPVTFYAEYVNNGDIVWKTSVINCSIETPSPTLSPTINPSTSPTQMPTHGPVSIHLDNTGCPDHRCGCPTNIDSECCLHPCDWEKYPAPIIFVSEKEKGLNTTFYVRRNIQNYPYQISVQFNISAVTEELARKYGFYNRLEQIQSGDFSVSYLNQTNFTGESSRNELNITYTIPTDCYFTDWDDEECEYYIDEGIVKEYPCAKGQPSYNEKNTCTWCDFYSEPGPRCNDIIPNDAGFIIPYTDLSGGDFEQSTFELSIWKEGCKWGCDWKGEVFLLELTNCIVMMNNSKIIVNNKLNCSLVYPSRAYIIVTDQDRSQRQEYIKVPDEKYDDWLWYAILAAVVVLDASSYVLFVWWRNKKIAEAHIAQAENDVAPVIHEEQTFLHPNNM